MHQLIDIKLMITIKEYNALGQGLHYLDVLFSVALIFICGHDFEDSRTISFMHLHTNIWTHINRPASTCTQKHSNTQQLPDIKSHVTVSFWVNVWAMWINVVLNVHQSSKGQNLRRLLYWRSQTIYAQTLYRSLFLVCIF